MSIRSVDRLEFGPGFEQNARLRSRALQASGVLDEVLGPSAGLVRAQWDLRTNGTDQPLLELTLSDSSGAVSGEFAEEELESDWHLRRRLYSLWGELLDRRLERNFNDLRQAVQHLESA